MTAIPASMRAIRLHAPGGIAGLVDERVDTPRPGSGEALVRVHAAAITRDELDWPTDRLPAIPSYELSGVVAALGPGTEGVAPGDEVYALADFERDGAAAEYAVVPARLLAPGRERSATSRAPRSRSPVSPPGRGSSTTATRRGRESARPRSRPAGWAASPSSSRATAARTLSGRRRAEASTWRASSEPTSSWTT